MDIDDGEGGNKITFPTSFASMDSPSSQALTPSCLNFLHRLREHQVLELIRAQLEPDAFAPTHVLELLLPAPTSRRFAEGQAFLGHRCDVGLRVALEGPGGRPDRSEAVADVVNGPALCGEREGELELWVCVWGMGSRRVTRRCRL